MSQSQSCVRNEDAYFHRSLRQTLIPQGSVNGPVDSRKIGKILAVQVIGNLIQDIIRERVEVPGGVCHDR